MKHRLIERHPQSWNGHTEHEVFPCKDRLGLTFGGEVAERIEELFQTKAVSYLAYFLDSESNTVLSFRTRAERYMNLLGGHPRDPRQPWLCVLEDKVGPAGEWSMALLVEEVSGSWGRRLSRRDMQEVGVGAAF